MKDQPIDVSTPQNSRVGLLQEDVVLLDNSNDSLGSCYYESDRPEGQPIDVSTPYKAIGFFPRFFGGGQSLSPIEHLPDIYSKGNVIVVTISTVGDNPDMFYCILCIHTLANLTCLVVYMCIS